MPDVHIIGELIKSQIINENFFYLPYWVPKSLIPIQYEHIMCHYEVIVDNHGDNDKSADFEHISGIDNGYTYISNNTSIHNESVLNQSIDIRYKYNTINRWIKLICTVYNITRSGKNGIIGYGIINIPLSSGVHTTRMYIHQPCNNDNIQSSDNMNVSLTTYILHQLGLIKVYTAYCNVYTALLSTTSRYLHSTHTLGYVDIQLNIIHNGIDQLPHIMMNTPSNNELQNYFSTTTACNNCFSKTLK